MSVDGTIISASQQQNAYRKFLKAIQESGPKTLHVFQVLLNRAGVPLGVTNRAADRILQRARKANQIVFSKGGWHIHMDQKRT